MRRLIGLALTVAAFVFLLVTASDAQTVREKLCIFSAAEKLPNILGLSITASRAKDGISVSKVAETLVNSFGNPMAAIRWLNQNFDFLMGEWRIKNAIETGQRAQVPQMIAKELEKKIRGAMHVEIDVRAAGQNATFTFVCAWEEAGRTITASTGISR